MSVSLDIVARSYDRILNPPFSTNKLILVKALHLSCKPCLYVFSLEQMVKFRCMVCSPSPSTFNPVSSDMASSKSSFFELGITYERLPFSVSMERPFLPRTDSLAAHVKFDCYGFEASDGQIMVEFSREYRPRVGRVCLLRGHLPLYIDSVTPKHAQDRHSLVRLLVM
ncbi:hypothetical protein PILCRDRAFT_636670 [Piloderma croceum F 1598]|uniref:Uncharacterized protein n=1 Tax=Piloderma croceum (strain F 1598) TaxID=765440 RepID=A0A0C3FA45_PILCF|nr:hypothetical protein PILCRDRAFT_636670 [Piloderma croceum F 1598]